jgi:hypothetical protein
MKRLFIILIAFLIGVSLFAFDIEDHPLIPSTVLIGGLNYPGLGTGFILTEDGYIGTAAHVVPIGYEMVVVTESPLHYRRARIVYHDPLHDVAILKIDIKGEELTPVKLGSLKGMKVGDPIISMGHPLGIGWLLTSGNLSGVKYDLNGISYIFADIAGGPGSSGSGIYNSNLELIGVIQQGIPGIGMIGIAIDSLKESIEAVIYNDRLLAPVREELKALSDRAVQEWRRLFPEEKKEEVEEEEEVTPPKEW